jgi:hypothetical protein
MAKRHMRKKMKGGTLSQQDIRQLKAEGFTNNQIETLKELGISLNDVMQRVDRIKNDPSFHGDPDYMTEQVMVEVLNENIFNVPSNELSAIPNADDDIHDIDISESLDDSFGSQGTMNLNELNISNISRDSGYTTNEDTSFGGKKHRRISRKKHGKKARKTIRNNNKREINLKGGMCFGKGVGANSYDPNNSIYNTNMLKLFPYKP